MNAACLITSGTPDANAELVSMEPCIHFLLYGSMINAHVAE